MNVYQLKIEERQRVVAATVVISANVRRLKVFERGSMSF
jgi:hypothetical protein